MSPKTALLVIDCQNFFAPMLGSALPNIKRLITQFQSTSSPILFTQHGHSEEELNTDPSPNQLVKKWGPSGSIAHGSDDWQLIPELLEYLPPSATSKHSLPLPSTDANTSAASNFSADDKTWPKICPKNTYDAFINTQLHQFLKVHGIQRVVVCGVMTDCCCDTTARSAFNRGFETWLVDDACGSANRTQHEAGLRGFGFAFGEVLGTKETVARLQGGE